MGVLLANKKWGGISGWPGPLLKRERCWSWRQGCSPRSISICLEPWVFLSTASFLVAVGSLCCLLVPTSANLLTLIFPNKWQEQSHGQLLASYTRFLSFSDTVYRVSVVTYKTNCVCHMGLMKTQTRSKIDTMLTWILALSYFSFQVSEGRVLWDCRCFLPRSFVYFLVMAIYKPNHLTE